MSWAVAVATQPQGGRSPEAVAGHSWLKGACCPHVALTRAGTLAGRPRSAAMRLMSEAVTARLAKASSMASSHHASPQGRASASKGAPVE